MHVQLLKQLTFCVITTLVLTHKAVTEHDNQAGVQSAANKPPLAM